MSQINVNTITGKDGGSAVNFPNGIIVTGVVTATSLNQTVNGNITATSFNGPLVGNVTGNVTSSGANTLGSLTVSNDATITGNLTVNGTTTTIDTAVTAVDTLAVDTKVAIGTDTYNTSDTVLQLNKNTSHAEVNIQSGNAHGALINFSDTDANGRGRIKYNHVDDSLSFRTAGTDRLFIDGNGTSKFKGPLTEK